jgi:thiol-disulfide isomerase/thioredoxin
MHRWNGSLFAVLLVVVPLTAEDKKIEDKSNDREQQFNVIKRSYITARYQAREAYQSAKTEEEKKAALDKLDKPGDQLAKILKLIEADPKDDLAFRMLRWEIEAGPGCPPQVFDLMAEHHLKNPEMAELCWSMPHSPAAAKLLRKVLEDSPNKLAKGCACFRLAMLADREACKGNANKADEAKKWYARTVAEFADVDPDRDRRYATGWGGSGWTLGERAKAELKLFIGMMAPEITSENLEGDKVHLKDYRGKVVVLDMWTTWCGPCRKMIPHEREIVEKLKDKPFALISISFDEKKDDLKKLLAKEAMPWTHWWNGPKGSLIRDWNITLFPTIYVLDAKGVIRYKNVRDKELEEAVEKLLAEMKDKT